MRSFSDSLPVPVQSGLWTLSPKEQTQVIGIAESLTLFLVCQSNILENLFSSLSDFVLKNPYSENGLLGGKILFEYDSLQNALCQCLSACDQILNGNIDDPFPRELCSCINQLLQETKRLLLFLQKSKVSSPSPKA